MTKHAKKITTQKQLIRELSKVFLLCFLLFSLIVLLALKCFGAEDVQEDFNANELLCVTVDNDSISCKYVGGSFGVFQSKEDLKEQEKKYKVFDPA